ncbi:MAG: hypothetical protein K2N47_00820, partial [Clostridia bacterium]|nr:hypothetical protein [Clostridia bacterium]
AVHVIPPFPVPKEWQENISIDPGLNNPLSAHWYAVDWDGNIYVVAEHFAAGKDIDYHSRCIREISIALGWKTDQKGRLSALIDSAANQRTLAAVKSVSELFSEKGILVNPKVNKDVFAGVCRVKEYLKRGNGMPDIFIFDNCTNMIAEFSTYFWADGDTPVKRDDHCMDELRYFVMSRPRPSERAEESSILIDKMRRIRRLQTSCGKGRKR